MKRSILYAPRIKGDLDLGLSVTRIGAQGSRRAAQLITGGRLPGGARQDVLDVSATQNYRLGSRMVTDEAEFIYGGAGAVLLPVGVVCQMPVPDTTHLNLVPVGVYAIDAFAITVTLAANAVTLNQYAEGQLIVRTGTGAGQRLRIASHPAAAGLATCIFTCYDKLVVATDGTSRFDLIANPYAGLIIHPSPPTAKIAGVTRLAVPISNFAWFQIGGPAAVLTNGVLYIFRHVRASPAVDGAISHAAVSVTTGPTAIAVMENGAIVIDSAGAESGPRFAKTAINTTYDLGPLHVLLGTVLRVAPDTMYSTIFLA